MKIRKPGDPFGNIDPLDPKDPQNKVKVDKAFLSHIEESLGVDQSSESGSTQMPKGLRTDLERIASSVNLNDPEQSSTAILASAKLLVHSRLGKKDKDTKRSARIVDTLSEYVAADPFMSNKILSILRKLKPI
jgi:hypothetical protein